MIKYHVIGLLCLAVVAIAGIEAAAQFYETSLNPKTPWYSSGKGWLMAALTIGAAVVYFRARKFRKKDVMKGSS
jgi:TRAP-type C4-dicarboxylate transport system permease small subunit